MKSALLHSIFSLLILSSAAQQLERSVIGSSGSDAKTNSIHVSYTIGEVIVTTQRSNTQILTQGFHQASISCNAPSTSINTRDATERCKDGNQQFINVTNNGSGTTPGVNYTYVITNTQNTVILSFKDLRFDINELQAGNFRIYGVFHEEEYNPSPGQRIEQTGTDICKRVSSNFIPLSISLPPSDAIILGPVNDTSLCGNAQISITAAIPERGNGTWRGSNGIQFSNPFRPNTVASGLREGLNTISWEVTTPGCPAKSSSISIEYTPPSDPAEILTGSLLSVCGTDGLRLQAKVPAADSRGRWKSNNPEVTFTPNDSAFFVTVNNLPSDRSAIYWVLGDLPCQTLDSIIVFNDEVSSFPEILTPPDTNVLHTICTNQVNLTARTPVEGETGFWRIIGSGNVVVEPNINSPTITLTNIPIGREVVATWEITKGNCVSESSTSRTFFNIGGVSAAEIFAEDSIVLCEGDPLQLSAREPGNMETGVWSANNTLSYSPERGSNEVTISDFPAGSTDITWSISAPNCPDNQANVNVFVIDDETSIFENDTEVLCQGDSALTITPLTRQLGEILSYTWSNGLSTPTIQVDPESGETIDLQLVLETEAGCEVMDELTVTRDEIGVEIAGTPICIDDDIIDAASLVTEISGSNEGIEYFWSNGSTTSSITVDEAGLYQVTVTTSNGCEASNFYEVIEEVFDAQVLPGDTTIDLGSSIQLTATGGDVYLWTPDPTLSCTNCQSPRATPEENTTYNVEITRFSGCTVNASIRVDILTENATCGQVFIPNILTPGNNGFNDQWVIENLSSQNEVLVYDRYGNQVFKASPYENNWSGMDVEKGTYLYIVRLNTDQVCRGSLTIIPDE